MWSLRMNQAMEYIEERLTEKIDYEELASLTGHSAVSFQQIFSIIADMSLSEYIRKRRMTLAAFELQNSKVKVIDIALKYGYETPEAFTRVFKEIHGVSPSQAKKREVPLKSYPRISFLLTIKGAVKMDYKVIEKESFKIYGYEKVFTMEDGKNFKEIPKFWADSMADGRCQRLLDSSPRPEAHAISYNPKGSEFSYMIFAPLIEGCNTANFKTLEVPAATWAIFKTEPYKPEETNHFVQGLIKRVYTEWLPTASYEKLDGWDIEWYHSDGQGNFVCEYWIRVK